MKSIILLIFAGLAGLPSAYAQIDWKEYSQSYSNEIRESPSVVALILAIRKENNSFWGMYGKSKHFETLKKDPDFRKLRSQEMVARTTFDTARVQFFLHGVNQGNAHEYEFRVTEFPSNAVVKPWKRIDQFTDSTLMRDSGFSEMGYLGGYRTKLGSALIMDVRKVESREIVSTSMAAWEPVRPEISSIYTSETVDAFFRQLQSVWLPDEQSTGSLAPGLAVPSTNMNLVFALQDGIFTKRQIQYQLIRNGEVYRAWQNNAYDNSFVWIKDCGPGNYTINIRYSAQPQHIASYSFKVEPVWYETNQFRILAGVLLLTLIGLLVLLFRQQKKARLQQIDKSRLQLELKAIYAQLNPHFVFNALSSIQGLINKQDLKVANTYLSDFAKLTRDFLVHSQKDQIALHEEIQTLDTYLRLEKLRFGFEYTISVDPGINIYETDIPAMLLQPLVENAVKHGVASMGEKGAIKLIINRSSQNMIVKLTDNGKGIIEGKSETGLGLKLTRERITLMNQLHREWQLTLLISNATPSGMASGIPSGTQIMLSFNQWF
ncbi:sensor histidine kinase [Dyadobacter sp. MSC1_007]|jgi:two-component system LytT family sensor kinase|uniref:sensor histidine kinase n=1 Tax=Dyadobacter sp. MSC1_007 TaxID=2909264 RepID=UPI00202E83AC|nr:histidine kinase [Dyadobacter sp. MSC1_007]